MCQEIQTNFTQGADRIPIASAGVRSRDPQRTPKSRPATLRVREYHDPRFGRQPAPSHNGTRRRLRLANWHISRIGFSWSRLSKSLVPEMESASLMPHSTDGLASSGNAGNAINGRQNSSG